jgi:hypothetical protein
MLYTADVEKLMHSLGLDVHLYADDGQQYCNGKPSDIADLKQKTVRYVDQVARWMVSNRLRLSASEMEYMWCATTRRQHLLDFAPIDLMVGHFTVDVSV